MPLGSKFLRPILALATALFALPALAQAPLVPVGQLIGTGASLVAGDVTFSNFALPPVEIFNAGMPLDGVGNIAASASVNADGTVSLVFTAIDLVTGAPSPITAASLQLIAYDVTVTNPAVLLSSVNQQFGPTTNTGFNTLQYREPALSFVATRDSLIVDSVFGVNPDGTLGIARGGVLYPLSCQQGGPNGCASPLPGGNRASLGLQNYFGVIVDHRFGFPILPISIDSIAMTFALVPADTPVTPIPITLGSIDVATAGTAFLALADFVDPVNQVNQPGFAPAGGVPVTLTTSDAAALPLPASVTMPQGSNAFGFLIGDANVDAPTFVTATASFNGVTVAQSVTVNPAVPLVINFFGASLQTGAGGAIVPNTIQLGASLNRVNVSPAVITLSSSNPAVAPVPASLNLPALTAPGDCRFECVTITNQPVGVDTPVTFSASLNGGAPVTATVTIPKTVDVVKVSKAELVLKNASLKVEATSTVPTAVLTLFNATTGQFIGTMTNSGPSGGGAKYSFQGTVSPVTTLVLNSSLNGTATGAVTQK